MRLTLVRTSGSLLFALAAICSGLSAGTIVTLPTGLAPGSEYRLVFVTADTYTATDSNIADYNSEVNAEANAISALGALGTTWTIIGATPGQDAYDNIGGYDASPIYGLDGDLIADDDTTDAGGLFSGSLQSGIDIDESGNSLSGNYVWTGILVNGGSFCTLGNTDCTDSGYASIGYASSTSAGLHDGLLPQSDSLSLYAISGDLTVPGGSTPEPSSLLLLSMGGAVMLFAMKRGIHRQRTAH